MIHLLLFPPFLLQKLLKLFSVEQYNSISLESQAPPLGSSEYRLKDKSLFRMIFLTFLFFFLVCVKEFLCGPFCELMEEVLESSRTNYFVPSELETLSRQQKQFS